MTKIQFPTFTFTYPIVSLHLTVVLRSSGDNNDDDDDYNTNKVHGCILLVGFYYYQQDVFNTSPNSPTKLAKSSCSVCNYVTTDEVL